MNKSSKILDKIKKGIQYDFDDEVNHRNKNTKTEIKFCEFHDQRLPIKQIPDLTYSLIFTDSVHKSDKNYYPQTLLE